MKSGYRIALCLFLLLLIPLYFLEAHFADLAYQYHAGTYLADWLSSDDVARNKWSAYNGSIKDKVVVMARLEEEPIQWVHEELPDWQQAIYIVNPSRATLANSSVLKTPINKGHEAMAYLTYVIEHYDRLPSTIAFIHSHRTGFLMAWHVDAPLHDNSAALRSLRLDFVQRNGYVNLRCNLNPGCGYPDSRNPHVTEAIWTEIFEGTSTPPINATGDYSSLVEREYDSRLHMQRKISPIRFTGHVAAPCCAQFAVSRDQVLQRPREDYLKIRQWVIDTEKTDAASGRVMEYLWHVIFGQESVYCPDQELCYCQVYGQC